MSLKIIGHREKIFFKVVTLVKFFFLLCSKTSEIIFTPLPDFIHTCVFEQTESQSNLNFLHHGWSTLVLHSSVT